MKKNRHFILFFVLFVLGWQLLFSAKALAAIVVGNPNGTVTLTEVFDYQCEFCRRQAGIISQLFNENTNLKIRLIPIGVINPTSVVQATALYALAKQHQWVWQIHQAFFSHRWTTNTVYRFLAHLPQVNFTHLIRVMHQPWIAKQLTSGMQLLEHFKTGTPLILVNPTCRPHQVFVFRGLASKMQLARAIAWANQFGACR